MTLFPAVVYAELIDLTNKLGDVINWKQFGINIGLSSTTIQIIEADYRRVEEYRLHLFLAWAKLEKPTWNKVVLALFNMGMKELAKTLGAQYGNSSKLNMGCHKCLWALAW